MSLARSRPVVLALLLGTLGVAGLSAQNPAAEGFNAAGSDAKAIAVADDLGVAF